MIYHIGNIILSIMLVIDFVYMIFADNSYIFTISILWFLTNLFWLISVITQLNDYNKIICLELFTTLISIIIISISHYIIKLNIFNFINIWTIIITIFCIMYLSYTICELIYYFIFKKCLFNINFTETENSENGFDKPLL